MKELYAENDEDRSRVDNSFVDMLAAAKGNEVLLNQARDYIEDLKDDDDLPEILAKRREQREIVKKNHQLGRSVEDMVKRVSHFRGLPRCGVNPLALTTRLSTI